MSLSGVDEENARNNVHDDMINIDDVDVKRSNSLLTYKIEEELEDDTSLSISKLKMHISSMLKDEDRKEELTSDVIDGNDPKDKASCSTVELETIRREKNRIHAKKTRLRKKKMTQEMEVVRHITIYVVCAYLYVFVSTGFLVSQFVIFVFSYFLIFFFTFFFYSFQIISTLEREVCTLRSGLISLLPETLVNIDINNGSNRFENNYFTNEDSTISLTPPKETFVGRLSSLSSFPKESNKNDNIDISKQINNIMTYHSLNNVDNGTNNVSSTTKINIYKRNNHDNYSSNYSNNSYTLDSADKLLSLSSLSQSKKKKLNDNNSASLDDSYPIYSTHSNNTTHLSHTHKDNNFITLTKAQEAHENDTKFLWRQHVSKQTVHTVSVGSNSTRSESTESVNSEGKYMLSCYFCLYVLLLL